MTASICLSYCLSVFMQNDLKHYQQIMKISGSVDNGPGNSSLYFGDIPDTGGSLTFNLSDIKGQRALLISNLLFYVTLNFKLPIYCISGYILHEKCMALYVCGESCLAEVCAL